MMAVDVRKRKRKLGEKVLVVVARIRVRDAGGGCKVARRAAGDVRTSRRRFPKLIWCFPSSECFNDASLAIWFWAIVG